MFQPVQFIQRHAAIAAILLVAIASVRIAATWKIFSATTDEVAHIACGMEWLDRGTYQLENQHPPLARVAAALGPYLSGVRSQGESELVLEGRAILLAEAKPQRILILARAGILPFFWIACAAVFLWAKRLMGPVAAALAVLIFTNVPVILGHAALATTDMALTAMLSMAVLAAIVWAEQPSWRTSLIFGLAGGLALLSKFSSLPFFAAAIIPIAASHKTMPGSRHLRWLSLASMVAALVTCVVYRFSLGPFFSGVAGTRWHNQVGHMGYLLGSWSGNGFWSYYPVNLGVKTPLACLALVSVGAVLCFADRRNDPKKSEPLWFSMGILVCAILFGRINIGIRHILPVYVGFSIVAAYGLMCLLRRKYAWFAGVVLLGSLLISSATSHPDYIGYFNVVAGEKPERILIDSDLDWGQDMKRLALRLRELQVTEFRFLPSIFPDLSEVPLPAIDPFDLENPLPGWHAAHITTLKLRQRELLSKNANSRFWTDSIEPTERVGKGILLWHLSPEGRPIP